MGYATSAAVMLLAGIGIPILAALNASLGRHLGSPASAAVVLFIVAFCAALVTALVTGPAPLARFATAPREGFLAGLFVAFYVLSITWVAPYFGVGNAVIFVLLGQMISFAVIDHFGLFGAAQHGLTLVRAGGIALMALGVVLTLKG
ncbi:DMT family transporter [Vannielia litorea]|uniref:DMT family transporter n=1 Tax=Vannielia litorea TaxID=1217970 RepID=UPI001C982004|nr:DMT family transporter [Vannielia litorea]MBY6048083.1 DMT family transporter [Vannielia litorea]MBY6075497.1 DMT family transporter [Vannielia litorea]